MNEKTDQNTPEHKKVKVETSYRGEENRKE